MGAKIWETGWETKDVMRHDTVRVRCSVTDCKTNAKLWCTLRTDSASRSDSRALHRCHAARRTLQGVNRFFTCVGRVQVGLSVELVHAMAADVVPSLAALPGAADLTSLLLAVARGHRAAVTAWLEAGVDADAGTVLSHIYPLHVAARLGHLTVVLTLMRHGASTERRTWVRACVRAYQRGACEAV